MNPEDGDAMMGRAGILVHPYMLGPNGQSNGCVSLKEYGKFLAAFKRGEVDRASWWCRGSTGRRLSTRVAIPVLRKWVAWLPKIF